MFKKVKRKMREWLEVDRGNSLQDALDNGLKMGNNVQLIATPNFGSEPYLISIGDDCIISFDVTFLTHDATAYFVGKLPGEDPQTGYFGPIIIEDNCFIGCRTTILPNVRIGSGCIIGAGSIVNRDIPAGMVAAGNPCRVICSLEEYRDKHKKKGDFLNINLWSAEKKKDYLQKYFKID